MTSPLQARYEKILLGLAVLSLTASSGWLGRQQGELRRLRALPVAEQLGGSLYEPANLPLPESGIAVWPKAPAQAQGPGWLYEVFTPPVIYYHAPGRSFTVTAPTFHGDLTDPFGLELLAVQQEQFRLQLAGYFGAPGDYLVAFTSPAQPETLFAREGRRFAELGLTLKSFDVRKILVEPGDERPVYDVAALAVLTDDRTGGEVVLDSRARKYTDTPLAVLQPLTGGARREVREGDTFADETSTYRIERIQLDPPEVVVARTTPGLPQPETRILRPAAPRGGLAGPAAGPRINSPRPVNGLATSSGK
jgi:hypothetical protein